MATASEFSLGNMIAGHATARHMVGLKAQTG
jgi:hypothetical protein